MGDRISRVVSEMIDAWLEKQPLLSPEEQAELANLDKEVIAYFDEMRNKPSPLEEAQRENTELRQRAETAEKALAETRREAESLYDTADRYRIKAETAEARAAKLKEELDELQLTFDLRWKADLRAIHRWREGHPERELTMPDHADMVVLLLEREARLRAQVEKLAWAKYPGSDVIQYCRHCAVARGQQHWPGCIVAALAATEGDADEHLG